MDTRDHLTGVYTRKAFLALADEMLAKNPGRQYDIVLSDFVGFKYFNQRYGSEMGDLLLVRTGQMLSAMAPDTLCGRYSGDRFVSLVERLNPMAIGFLDHFALPEEARKELPVASIVVKFGICRIEDNRQPVSVSCDRAVMAVEAVKHTYGKNVGVYDDRIGADRLKEILIEEQMKEALENDRFEVYYQPKIDVENGRICGAEALVRWTHPTMGFISPGVFIPLFEKNGFITEMDIYIWDRVCRDMAAWRDGGKRCVPVSVNASRKDFNREELPEIILGILDKYGIDHGMFHLEVTESTYSDDPERTVRSVDRLAKAGVVIELDDFGTGYTSLSCLSDMHIDILKLDMSLLRKDRKKRGILEFATNIARMMHLPAVQEGVETPEDAARVRELGVEMAQGFLYASPMPREEFEKLLEE